MVILVRATSSSLNWTSIASRILPEESGREFEMAERGAMDDEGGEGDRGGMRKTPYFISLEGGFQYTADCRWDSGGKVETIEILYLGVFPELKTL